MRPSVTVTDPFGERVTPKHRRSLHLLGALFRFESDSVQLLRLVERAFAGLPRHRLGAGTLRLRVRLQLAPRQPRKPAAEPPPLQTWSGPGFVCGAMGQ